MSNHPIPWVKFNELPDNGGSFVVAPLGRGMGTTVGNAMRRVLLSSLTGYALTSVVVKGAKHEFSTLPNVVEDVFDIVSNLKGVAFKGTGDDPKTLKIDISKKGKVTAKDIQCDSSVEIVNPSWYIAEVGDGGKLHIEMTLEKGTGYRSAEANTKAEQVIDIINIDSSFSPIVKVNHQVKNIRVGKELDYDSLSLDVWTNGSITPEDAVQKAAQILVDKLNLFERLNEEPKAVVEEATDSGSEKLVQNALNLSIDDLELSARSSNCLKRAGIEAVSELVEKDMSELIQIKNFGKKSADEINDKLKQYGLALKGFE